MLEKRKESVCGSFIQLFPFSGLLHIPVLSPFTLVYFSLVPFLDFDSEMHLH